MDNYTVDKFVDKFVHNTVDKFVHKTVDNTVDNTVDTRQISIITIPITTQSKEII